MAKYLNHAEYNRWYRSYLITLDRFVNHLDALRVVTDDLQKKEVFEEEFSQFDEKFDEIIPRDFNPDGSPLTPGETFLENCKVLINGISKLLKKQQPFTGIYQEEKSRVLKKHQEYRFKEKFYELKRKLEVLIIEHQRLEKERIEKEKEAQEKIALQEKLEKEKGEQEEKEKQMELEMESKADSGIGKTEG